MPDGAQSTTTTLEDLMIRLIAGDSRAFDPLFVALWSPALRYARHLLTANTNADPSTAEDVTQRALIRLFEEAPAYRRGSSVLAWALSLTYWEARSERQRIKRSKLSPLSDTEPVDKQTSALDLLIDEEARRELNQLLAALDPEERALLGLEDSNLSPHLSPSAVRKRRQRLLARVRRAFFDLAFAREDDRDD